MTKLEELIAKLSELFELDKADLDFGIHRIIKSKHAQIGKYLTNRLPQRVSDELGKLAAEESASQLATLRDQVTATFGADAINEAGEIKETYASTPLGQKYEVVREASGGADPTSKSENEVYSHLLEFVSRYYVDYDYLSLRRRTAGRESYSVPYNGEEVVLHWANKDQYYIKSSEDLKDYTFTVPLVATAEDGEKARVQFKLTRMDAVQNNNKATRIFQLDSEAKITSTDDSLVIPFHFAEGKKRTKPAEAEWEQSLLDAVPKKWQKRLAAADATYTGDGQRTVLQKHLRNYTRKNTTDYFIHKDLGGFLRRELDFYVKNEVMYLDDIENRPPNYLESEIRKIKAIRAVAHDLIDFLAQFEDFQKRLWLKKKFVIETNWCITLDRVPEELYPEIAANAAQREEWVNLFAIDEIEGDLVTPKYSAPLKAEFLKANDKLVLDSAFFPSTFKYQLFKKEDDVDAATNGLLVHAENFHALSLLVTRYRGQAKCIYIDPPYNTKKDRFPYRDGYKDSSWIAMISDRLKLGRQLLRQDGVLWSSIDKHEFNNLDIALASCFGKENRVGELVWRNARDNNPTRIATEHEFILCYAQSANDTEQVWKNEFADAKELLLSVYEKLKEDGLSPSQIQTQLRAFIRDNKSLLNEVDRYKFVDEGGVYTGSQSVHNPHPGGYEYDIPHPVTKKPMRLPATGYRFPKETMWRDYIERERLLYGPDEHRIIQIKLYLADYQDSLRSVIDLDGRLGSYALTAKFGEEAAHLFENPKPPQLLERLLSFSSLPETLVVDFFAGSGATGEAAIAVGRSVDVLMKYILVDMADYFDSVLKPRVAKSVYSANWKNGHPVAHSSEKTGISHSFKYIRLESYEDALNNLTLEDRSPDLLGQSQELQDEYLLRYCLDTETAGSLLDCQRFQNPFDYKLKIHDRTTGEAKPQKVDLPETFNYLLGLKVRTMQMRDGALVIEGENPAGETVCIIWRNVAEMDNKKLEKFLSKTLRINTADTEYAAIYINGDTTLADPHKKLLLTEQVFHNLMFDVADV